ncbi:DUF4175 domain-containing protein [Jannaschia sp. KMU-145]|uniref:DUF4175 domain-containing protein n=1 Tax=Jannaschia halovivens TaxID=3388667 RepID=UPI00396B44B8
MAETRPTDAPDARLRRQLRLTHAGLWAERVTRAFWPAWTAAFIGLAAYASDLVPPLWEWSLIGACSALVLVLAGLGLRGFHAPTRAEARARLDATLPGRPIATLADDQAIGGSDPQSQAVWAAHRRRMAARLDGAKAVAPDLRVSDRDPYATRYMALTLLAVALLFGTLWRPPAPVNVSGGGEAQAAGLTWEGWLEPPRHTGLPTLYLADIAPGEVEVPEGTRVTLRLYGTVGALSVSETVSGRDVVDPTEAMQDFIVTQSGTLAIDGTADAPVWTLTALPDAVPEIEVAGEAGFDYPDQMTLPWAARDDHGVTGAQVVIALDRAAADRSHGLAADPDPRDPVELDLALPITGDRTDIREVFRADLTEHPLAGMPVELTLEAADAAGQTGQSTARIVLPARPFYDPVASALVEQRRDLLWARSNDARVTRLLRAMTWKADDTFDNPPAFLIVRMAIRRLAAAETLDAATQDEVAAMLWEAAIRLEENSLDSALERLRQAQERLSEAIRQGAPPEEIARLMDEMRDAMDDYTRQLAQQDPQQGQQQQQAQGEMQEVTPDMLEEMMRRIEELMEQGRTAEAQELLRQLQEMMENMQVTQGQGGGEGEPGEGEQAMQDLRDSLREQQGLSDEGFRQLQEQFNPNAQAGEGQQNEGPNGGQGRGTEHSQTGPRQGQPGQQEGQEPGEGQGGQAQSQQPGGQSQNPSAGGGAGDLAARQEALRRGLEQLRENMPGGGSEAGEAARDAIGRAEDAMRRAEEDLGRGSLGEALDDQAEAMDALRDGMQELGRAMAEERQQGNPGEGEGQAATPGGGAFDRDPLGRQSGQGGRLGTDESFLNGPDAARRARDLMDEIRRRSGERDRPQLELDYLRRLLERF